MLIGTKKTSRENPVYFDTKTGTEIVLNKVKGKGHGKLPAESQGFVKSR